MLSKPFTRYESNQKTVLELAVQPENPKKYFLFACVSQKNFQNGCIWPCFGHVVSFKEGFGVFACHWMS